MSNTTQIRQLERRNATTKCRIKDLGQRGQEMTTKEAAEFLGVSVSRIQKMVCYKEIPAYKFLGRVVLFENELIKYKNAIMTAII